MRNLGEYVHLAARSATRRRFRAKNRGLGALGSRTFPTPYGLGKFRAGKAPGLRPPARASAAGSGNRATLPPRTRLRALSAPRLAILGGVAPKHFHPRLIWEENGPAVT